MKLHLFKSVKSKLSFFISIVLGIISLFVYLYFPAKIEEEGLKALQREASIIANIASYNVGAGIYFDDYDAVATDIETLIKNPNIVYVIVKDDQDSIFYAYNLSKAIDHNYLGLNHYRGSLSDREELVITSSLEFQSSIVGTMYLGYSLNQLLVSVDAAERSIAYVSIVIFIIGVLVVYLIGIVSLKPLLKVAETAEEISSGRMGIRAPIITEDEVGNLAQSFNVMVDKLSNTHEELEIVNKQLEDRVLERTQQLSDSEERFRGIYENSTIGIYRTSISGKIILANPALLKMLGYKTIQEFQSIKKEDEIYNNHDDYYKFLEMMASDEQVIGFEQYWRKRNGELIFIRESAKATKDEHGNIVYYDGTVEDITLKNEYEKTLIKAKESAESAVKMKTEFLAQMSHEIRTPINSILSYSQLLKSEILDLVPDDLKISFDMINNGGRRLIRTVDMILNMSELQTGTYEVIKEEIDIVNDVLNPLVGEFKTAAESKELSIILINRLEDHQAKLVADMYTVTQIFANLIDNAIKYTPKGSIEVVAYINYNKQICVDVQDTGIGISEKFQETLFEPFTQEEQGYTRKFEGNGLGMALVKEYCNLNEIQITLESEKDKGSLFTVHFPD